MENPVSAEGQASGDPGNAMFQVLATNATITLDPNSASPNDTITVTGAGFMPGGNVSVDWAACWCTLLKC